MEYGQTVIQVFGDIGACEIHSGLSAAADGYLTARKRSEGTKLIGQVCGVTRVVLQ